MVLTGLTIFWFFVAPAFILFAVIVIYIMNRLSYNIPVVIFRYVGNKGRPMFGLAKAKKWTLKGVTRLKVRGYKMAIRDFRAENYYPVYGMPRAKFGGLVLWEYEDGMLTPNLPKHVELSKEEQARFDAIMIQLQAFQAIPFEFDEKLHEGLKLKAVDDVDIDFMIAEHARIDSQYTGGIWGFLDKYGGMIILLIISVIILVSVVTFFQKAPELAKACADAAVQNSQTLLEKASQYIQRPPA
jgi:lipoprotein signal peptidase